MKYLMYFMDEFNQKYIDALIEAEKEIKVCDYMIYVTYPVVKDSKLLLRAMDSLSKAVVRLISVILKFEYVHNHLKLGDDKKENLELFFSKCASKYCLDESGKELLREILKLKDKQKDSVYEFSRNGKAVIYDEEMNISSVSLSKVKIYLTCAKGLLGSTKAEFKKAKV
jgi:hypothetical protein